MSVRWERLAGDTARFAMKIAFAADPHGGSGAEPELAESWGALQLWVEGVNVCAHVDSGETLEANHWYLLPFLEWLAQEWSAIFHEEHLPVPGRSDDAASVLLPWADLGSWSSSAEIE